MPSPPTLIELQRRFAQALLTQSSDRLAETVRSGSLSAEARIDIYASGYLARLSEAVSADFARTRELLGDERFESLLDDYLLSHPSISWAIDELSEGLSPYLATREETYASELARLEWACVLSAQAPVVEQPFDFARAIAQLDEEGQARLRLELAPCVELYESEWAIEPLQPGKRGRTRLVIHRRDNNTCLTPLTGPQWTLLQGIREGQPVVSLMTAESAPSITQWFANWVSQGIISGIRGS